MALLISIWRVDAVTHLLNKQDCKPLLVSILHLKPVLEDVGNLLQATQHA